MRTCQAVDECLFFFNPEIWGILKPKYLKTYKKSISDEKTTAKKTSSTGWQGFIQHMCQFQGIYPKRGADIGCINIFGAICLNQPVEALF